MITQLPSCKTVITPIGPWFHMAPLVVEMPTDLKPHRFARFDYNLEFAGSSARGICLSVKGSAGPARIGPYPILERVGPGWAVVKNTEAGLLLRTDRPHLAFIGIRGEGEWRNQCYEGIGLPRSELAEVFDLSDSSERSPQSRDIRIKQLAPEIVRVIAQHANQLKLVFAEGQLHIRCPETFHLRQDQWRLFGRHIYTGTPTGRVGDTVPLDIKSHDFIKLPGKFLPEVVDRWGIAATPPLAYDGANLLFRSVGVADATKLSRKFIDVKRLQGRTLRAVGNRYRLFVGVHCDSEISDLPRFALGKAAELGILPRRGKLTVNPDLEHVFMPLEKVQIASLKCPVEFRPGRYAPLSLLCPQSLVHTQLIKSAQATRSYVIPSHITRYSVHTVDPVTAKLLELCGTFYLRSDLASLTKRNIRQEKAERHARYDRLVARYGPDLPTNYERHTDQELELYFKIKESVARGEIVLTDNHPLLPHGFAREKFLEWIEEVAPDKVLKCPVTSQHYLHPLSGMEELAGLPGFWKAVEQVLGESSWLRELVLNPSVQVAALTHTI